MADTEIGRQIIGVSRVAAIYQGLSIQFDLQFADGSSASFHCGHRPLIKMLGDLRMLGTAAEKARSATPDQAFGVVRPLRAVAVRAVLEPTSKEIGLGFQTPEGIPLEVVMTEGLARQAIQSLQMAIDHLPTSPDQNKSVV